ncbi:MAG: hypothetical protein WCD89_10400 [Anaerocolumna sp.]
MIPFFLQQALVKELKALFKGYKLINSKNELIDINVFSQHLPYRRKEDDKPPFPYILVCLEEGEIPNTEDYNVKIYLVIGVHDLNENAQGDMEVINIITTIYEHLFNKIIIDDRYEIDYPFKWAIQDEDTFPKFFGGAETNWKLKTMKQKEDEFI